MFAEGFLNNNNLISLSFSSMACTLDLIAFEVFVTSLLFSFNALVKGV